MTTTVALTPPAFGRSLGGVAVDQLGESAAQAFGAGLPLAERPVGRGLVFGGGEGQEGLLERGAGEGVEGEPAVDLAVSVLPHREPGGGGRVAFLAFEELGFVGVGGVGVDDFQEPASEPFQRAGVEVLGLGEQVGLGVLDQRRVEVGGEVVEGPEDDLGLLDVHPTLGEGVAGLVVGLQSGGQPDGAVGGGAGGLGVVGQPGRGRRGTGPAGDVERLGLGDQPGS